MYNNNFKKIDEFLFSKKNRFRLIKKDQIELKKIFLNSNILITGAAGSIGSSFVKKLNKFNFKKIYLLDKNENELTELNRDLAVSFKKKILRIEFICADLNIFDLKKFISQNKITHYLNFAAIKHVRSEENIYSIEYMFSTNSKNFLPLCRFNRSSLKQVFSISTDKSVNPSSFLGVSKYLMEQKLAQFKKKNKAIRVSTSRFANVSFSNGSILKSIYDNIKEKKIFGIPKNIFRYFITHDEASDLCFKSLLSRNDNKIIVPSSSLDLKEYSIQYLCEKICKFLGYKAIFRKTFNQSYKNKKIYILINKLKTYGQKKNEKFSFDEEEIKLDYYDKSIEKIDLKVSINPEIVFKKMNKIISYHELKKFFNANINKFTFISQVNKLSKIV